MHRDHLTDIVLSSIGRYRDNVISFFIAIAGTIASLFLGGWDGILNALVFCLVLDFCTGLLGAMKKHTVNSVDMFWGGVRKASILAVVALAVKLDGLVGNQTPVFRTLALYFYVGREGLSIIENLGVLGVPMPGFIIKLLSQLQEKGEDQSGKGI